MTTPKGCTPVGRTTKAIIPVQRASRFPTLPCAKRSPTDGMVTWERQMDIGSTVTIYRYSEISPLRNLTPKKRDTNDTDHW